MNILPINEEVGYRNLSKIVKNKKTCEIYFHIDLDGIASALVLKQFLKTYYNISLKDVHVIQYGGLEFAVKQSDLSTDNIPVLVDFAHVSGSLNLQIATDHHQSQAGGDNKAISTYFKPARSNAETLSAEVSYGDIFTDTDLRLIQTVDSANFLKMNIKPEDVQNSLFKVNRELSGEKNRFLMGFVVNRLLLAYKNKRISVESLDKKRVHKNRNILECLALDCNPSLYSIFTNIKHYVRYAKTDDRRGVLAKPEELMNNLSNYIERMKTYKYVEDEKGETSEYDSTNWRHKKLVDSGTKIMKGSHYDADYEMIIQYGGGSMIQPGSYDRYVPFKNNPEASFYVIVWPMGLVQASCNPFKEAKIEDIDLGEISKEMLLEHKSKLETFKIPLDCIKKESETSQDWKKMKKAEGEDYEGVGFKYSDLVTFYGDVIKDNYGKKIDITSDNKIKSCMNQTYERMNDEDKNYLNKFNVSLWDMITKNSGGHKKITNISGISMAKYDSNALKRNYGFEKYTDLLKKIARDLVNLLKSKIDEINKTGKVEYNTGDVKLSGGDLNESKKLKTLGHIYKSKKNKVKELYKIDTYSNIPSSDIAGPESDVCTVESWSKWKKQ